MDSPSILEIDLINNLVATDFQRRIRARLQWTEMDNASGISVSEGVVRIKLSIVSKSSGNHPFSSANC